MSKLDKELMDFVKRNRALMNWLLLASKKIEYGSIVINYHAGKITSFDMHRKMRTVAKEEGKLDHEDI